MEESKEELLLLKRLNKMKRHKKPDKKQDNLPIGC